MSKKIANIGGDTVPLEDLQKMQSANERHWKESFAVQATFLKDVRDGKFIADELIVSEKNPHIHKLIKTLEDLSQ